MSSVGLQLEITNYHITGSVTRNNGTKVVEASTREFCIARHLLYKTTDVSASHNIGRVLAHQYFETGVYRVLWEEDWTIKNNPKVVSFISGVRSEGLLLNEPKFSEKEML
ncbi:large ribosomal subunit protein uL18m-like [Dysidea avara]|uniref:large ribosomal subunit protein uL18m-like n=1 Tax=Dysidea avara TaxID=196820 RepID=UPI003319D085